MHAWIEEELRTVAIGDKRLDARFAALLGQFGDHPGLSIPAACGERKEAVAGYRFFDNEKVDEHKVLQPHHDATRDRCQREPVILAIQDTTEVDLTRKNERVGGPLNKESRRGMFMHPVLTLTPERLPLGVWDIKIWSRDPKEFAQSAAAKKKQRRLKPFDEKESYRWLEGYHATCKLKAACPNTHVISVADSEADIYEIFVAVDQMDEQQADFIIRSSHDDRVLQEDKKNLRQALLCRKSMGRMTIEVSRRDTSPDSPKRKRPRSARKAKVSVRAMRTLLKPPYRPDAKLPSVWINAVLVLEENPPAGEEPIEWLLVTSLPIAKIQEAQKVITYYCSRWEIEVFFRTLKSGCKIEKLQLETNERIRPCLAMYMIVAWRIMHLTMLSRTQPNMRCDTVLEEAEWKAIYTIVKKRPAPKTPPTLQEIVAMIAQLGGYQGRTRDCPPGPKAMWIGLQRMRDFALAYESFGPGRVT